MATDRAGAEIGIYRGNITPLARLLQTTVGRKDMLDDLVEKLKRNAGKRGGQHYLFIGPRGIGKTHFLTLIENAVKTDEVLRQAYTVIRFPEENNRILSFADILLGIIEILGDSTDDREWRTLYTSLSSIEKDEEIIDTILPKLKHSQKQTGRVLLLLLENLDTMLTDQIKREQDIHRFRSFLMDSPCATLIGTSPVYFSGLSNIKSPFHDFFDIQVLEDLSEDEMLKLIRNNLEWEKRDDLLSRFDTLIPKIRSLHIMTGGNPRLTIMLYELIAHDNLLDVKVQFRKLLDQISPFYQDRLKDLAPQERALLETIALMRSEPRTPTAIARHLRKPPQQTSSLLKRMTEAGYLAVSTNPRDKRSRLYRIKEGFFDLWLAMSESRTHRKRLAYLSEFFEMYYSELAERERKRKELWQRLEKEPAARENNIELLGYLSDLGGDIERLQTKLELALHKLKEGDAQGVDGFLAEMKTIPDKHHTFIWIADEARKWTEDSADLDLRKWLDELIEYWRTQRSGDLERAVEIAERLNVELSDRGLHALYVALLEDTLLRTSDAQEKINLLIRIGKSQKMVGRLDVALESLESALLIAKEIGDRDDEGACLNNISTIYFARGDYDTALKHLQESLAIAKETGDRSVEGTALNNIGQIYSARGDYDTALTYHREALAIRKEIGDLSGTVTTLHNIAMLELKKGETKSAFDREMEAYRIALKTGNAEGLFYIGRALGKLLVKAGNRREGVAILRRALEIGHSATLPGTEEIQKMLNEAGGGEE